MPGFAAFARLAGLALLAGGVTPAAVAQTGWTQLAPPAAPAPRAWYGAAFDIGRGTTVLFGGWNGAPFGDTWEWNGTTWQPLATPAAPAARTEHAMAYDFARSEILLFGGTQGGGNKLNDTWVFANGTWTQRAPAASPGPRVGSRLAFDTANAGMLLFGGANGSNYFDETWTWDGATWTRRTAVPRPSPRYSPAMGPDLLHGRIVLFGGLLGGNAMQDTWTWNGSGWTQLVTPAMPPGLRYGALNFDLRRAALVLCGGRNGATTETWLLVDDAWRQDPRPMPATRDGACVTADLLRDRLLLFGGLSFGSFVADTWEYEVGTIATWQSRGAGCAGSAGVPLLRAIPGSPPRLGGLFGLELMNAPGSVAAVVIGASDQRWNGVPLPLDLGVLGMPGCVLRASADTLLVATATAGRATWTLLLPAAPALVGVPFFAQGLAIDPTANALGAVVSNAGAGVFGPF